MRIDFFVEINMHKRMSPHVDFDCLVEATTILDNYKVDCTYINEGRVNFYEQKIKDKYRTKAMKEGTTFNIGNFSFSSLNHNLDDENYISIVLYGKYNNLSIMFMGDSSIRSEESILNNYNLGHVNILKVGHHGSRTSTSNQFLDIINSDIALISVGVNNKFNHPHKEIIERLKNIM